MAIDPISLTLIWFIAGATAGATVAVFWDEIKSWAYNALCNILDSINRAIEVTSDAVAYLVKEGTRIYKRTEVFVENVRTGNIVIKYKEERVSESDVPNELRSQLDRKKKIEAVRYST